MILIPRTIIIITTIWICLKTLLCSMNSKRDWVLVKLLDTLLMTVIQRRKWLKLEEWATILAFLKDRPLVLANNLICYSIRRSMKVLRCWNQLGHTWTRPKKRSGESSMHILETHNANGVYKSIIMTFLMRALSIRPRTRVEEPSSQM